MGEIPIEGTHVVARDIPILADANGSVALDVNAATETVFGREADLQEVLNLRNADGTRRCSWHSAAFYNDADMARTLKEMSPASVNDLREGLSPLLLALMKKSKAVAQVILSTPGLDVRVGQRDDSIVHRAVSLGIGGRSSRRL
jgi:hypothetical protein